MPTLTQLAAKEFASKHTGRYSITGVFISTNGDVVATDGKFMARIGAPPQKSKFHTYPKKGVIVSTKAIEAFLKTRRINKDANTRVVNVSQYKRSCTFRQQAGRKIRVNENAIDGVFPDYTSILPDKNGFITDVLVDAGLLAKIVSHIKKYGDPGYARICIPVNQDNAIEVHAKGRNGEEMLYLLMPVKREGTEKLAPEDRDLNFFVDNMDPSVFSCAICRNWNNPLVPARISEEKIKKERTEGKRWCSAKKKFTKGDSTCMKITGSFKHKNS